MYDVQQVHTNSSQQQRIRIETRKPTMERPSVQGRPFFKKNKDPLHHGPHYLQHIAYIPNIPFLGMYFIPTSLHPKHPKHIPDPQHIASCTKRSNSPHNPQHIALRAKTSTSPHNPPQHIASCTKTSTSPHPHNPQHIASCTKISSTLPASP